mgnify:CR=1 FL=1
MSSLQLPTPPSSLFIKMMHPKLALYATFFTSLVFMMSCALGVEALISHGFIPVFGFFNGMLFIIALVVSFFSSWTAFEVFRWKGWGVVINARFHHDHYFRDCKGVYDWIRLHPEVATYIEKVQEQGRMLYLGDMLLLRRWVRDVRVRQREEKHAEAMKPFCSMIYHS